MVRQVPARRRPPGQGADRAGWTRRGRAPDGFFTRSTAEAWLQQKLTELDGHARRAAAAFAESFATPQ